MEKNIFLGRLIAYFDKKMLKFTFLFVMTVQQMGQELSSKNMRKNILRM